MFNISYLITSLLRSTPLFVLFLSCQTTSSITKLAVEPSPSEQKTTITGQQIMVAPLVEGTVNVYYKMISIEEANLYNPYFPYNTPEKVPQYYIGKRALWRIDEWNYEAVLKEVFSDVPYLIKKIGHQGFRFENLSQMVYFYNDKLAKEVAIKE